MADNDQPRADADGDEDYAAELAHMKSKRNTLRRQITVTNRQIETLTSSRGSRGAIQGLLLHLNDLLLRTSQFQTDISSMEDEEE
jgi:acyl-CoA synthetase (AMP-forming)/AMP-acid ligase II